MSLRVHIGLHPSHWLRHWPAHRWSGRVVYPRFESLRSFSNFRVLKVTGFCSCCHACAKREALARGQSSCMSPRQTDRVENKSIVMLDKFDHLVADWSCMLRVEGAVNKDRW